MANDVDISVGADTSAASARLAELRNGVAKLGSDIRAEFAKPLELLSIGGLVAGMQQAINKGEELHHLSAKFGIDAQQLQDLGNAAKESGVSMESVARATNKLIISQEDAIRGSTKQTEAFDHLGVSVEDLKTLGPEELMLRLADGVHNASDRTAAYADIATLLGARMGTDLIPMLEQGSKAIQEQANAWGKLTNAEIEELHHTKVEEDYYLQRLGTMFGKATAGWGLLFDAVSIRSRQFWANVMGDAAGGAAALADLEELRHRGFEKHAPVRDPDGPPASPVFEGASAGAARPGDKLDSLYRQNYLDQLNGEEKIVAILHEKWDLQDQLNRGIKDGTSDIDEEDSLRGDILGKEKEIKTVQDQLAKAQEKYNQEVYEARQAAEDEATDEERRLMTLRLQAAGHEEIAQQLKEQWDLEDKIGDLTDRINQAWAEGNQELAKQLTNIRDQVKEEEKLVSLRSQNSPEAVARRQKPGGDLSPAGAVAGGFSNDAATMATDPTTGKIDMEAYTRNRALEERNLLLGKGSPWSVADIQARQELLSESEEKKDRVAATGQRQSDLREADLLGLIASGRSGNISRDDALRYPDIGSLVGIFPAHAVNVSSAGAPTTSPQLQAQINLMQAQLEQLEQIAHDLRPGVPGTSI